MAAPSGITSALERMTLSSEDEGGIMVMKDGRNVFVKEISFPSKELEPAIVLIKYVIEPEKITSLTVQEEGDKYHFLYRIIEEAGGKEIRITNETRKLTAIVQFMARRDIWLSPQSSCKISRGYPPAQIDIIDKTGKKLLEVCDPAA